MADAVDITPLNQWIQWGANALLGLGLWAVKSLHSAISDLRKSHTEVVNRLNVLDQRQTDAIETLRRDVTALNARSESNAQKLDSHLNHIIEIHRLLSEKR